MSHEKTGRTASGVGVAVLLPPLVALNGENSRAKVQNVRGDSSPPHSSLWPLGRTTELMRPKGAPLLTGCRVTVTSSPNANDRRLKPTLLALTGFWVSITQRVTAPFSSLTSIVR